MVKAKPARNLTVDVASSFDTIQFPQSDSVTQPCNSVQLKGLWFSRLINKTDTLELKKKKEEE